MAAYAGAGITKTLTANILYETIHDSAARERFLPTVVSVFYNEDKTSIIEFGSEHPAFFLVDRFVMTSLIASMNITPELPEDLQKRNLTAGMALKFSAGSPGGRPEFEILGESLGSSKHLVLEIFERVGKPVRPYPAFLPFGIQDLGNKENPEISASNDFIFLGRNQAGLNTALHRMRYLTQKTASISSIDYERSIFAINGTVTGGDFAAPILLSECGTQKLVGLVAGSYAGIGAEKEAFGIETEKAIGFFEEITGVEIQTRRMQAICPEPDPVLTERLAALLVDGLPDSSYDLSYLTRAVENMDNWWVRPFESIIPPKKNGENQERIVGRSLAFLVDKYVGVPTSSLSFPIEEKEYRILWGGKFDGNETDPVEYEYLEFKGYDDTRQFALFLRLEDTGFPLPEGLPFLAGSANLLEVKDVLYKVGTVDFGLFAPGIPYPIQQSLDPAFVIGFSGEDAELLEFESNLSKEEIGAAIFELIDGVPHVAGFFYAPLNDWGTETQGSALSIEFVLNAVKEITCRDPSLSCLDLTSSLYKRKIPSREIQARRDRYQIIQLLGRAQLDSLPLMTDLLKPDAGALSKYGGRIVIFFVDETGALIAGTPAMEGETTFLSKEYALTTASLFPRFTTQSEKGFGQEAEYAASNILFESSRGNRVEVRIGVVDKFSTEPEMFELIQDIPFISEVRNRLENPSFLKDMERLELASFAISLENIFHRHNGTRFAEELERIREYPALVKYFLGRPDVQRFFDNTAAQMQILNVERIDWKQGYALLRRSSPPLRNQSDLRGLRILKPEEIPADKSILISHTQYVFRTGDLMPRLSRVSPGFVAYASETSPVFIINGFASMKNLGSSIFTRCGEGYCPVGIVERAYPINPDKIQTEGFGLSLDFILKQIKEDTGIDLYQEIKKGE